MLSEFETDVKWIRYWFLVNSLLGMMTSVFKRIYDYKTFFILFLVSLKFKSILYL